MPSRPMFVFISAVTACNYDSVLTASSRCDATKQSDEEYVDSPFDADGDGFFDGSNPDCQATYDASALDCDDRDPDVHPEATETLCNGLDDDCDDTTPDEVDEDGDGALSCSDCNDSNPDVHPGVEEIECNGLNDDCDDTTPDGPDRDGDGATACTDCDDEDALVSPENTEVECNGLDDDCNPGTSDGIDADGDGVTDCTDCDDNDPATYPGAEEVCGDGVDQDCDGEPDDGCSSDYTGTYTLDRSVSYSCAFGLVNFNFGQLYIVDTAPTIAVTSLGASVPGTMVGSFATATDFSATTTLSGTCNETYSISGTFDSENTFTSTITAQFSGSCFDCTNQTWSVAGAR